jgi:hypothetical protein
VDTGWVVVENLGRRHHPGRGAGEGKRHIDIGVIQIIASAEGVGVIPGQSQCVGQGFLTTP